MYGSSAIITAATGDTKDWELDVRFEVEEKEYGRESVGGEQRRVVGRQGERNFYVRGEPLSQHSLPSQVKDRQPSCF